MIKMAHTFIWKHGESIIQLPVKLGKSTDSGYGIQGSLVCNECNHGLKQVYKCDCGQEYTIKGIKKRYDKENEIIYEYNQKKQFMKGEVDTNVKVLHEITMAEVLLNIEYLKGFFEIYNNENNTAIATMKKIHRWLKDKQRALLVSFGHREKNRAGLILPTKNKLVLVELRDYRLVRTPKQQGLIEAESEIEEVLNSVTEDKEPELYQKFVELIRNGEQIEIREETRNEEVLVECSFLDD